MSRWLVGSSSSSRSGRVASARASEARVSSPSGEGHEGALGLLAAETEAAQHREDAVAPAVAAAMLEALLGGGVCVQCLLAGFPGRHRRLQSLQLRLRLQHLGAAGEDVLAERDLCLARRTLIVQGDARSFLQDEAAGIRVELTRQHAQQGRLAGSVASGERHPLTRLELEGDAFEQQLAAHVDVEAGCGGDRHRVYVTRLGRVSTRAGR